MPMVIVSKERAKEIFPRRGTRIIFGTRLRKTTGKSSTDSSAEQKQPKQKTGKKK